MLSWHEKIKGMSNYLIWADLLLRRDHPDSEDDLRCCMSEDEAYWGFSKLDLFTWKPGNDTVFI